jgi:hypothetical protein
MARSSAGPAENSCVHPAAPNAAPIPNAHQKFLITVSF